MPYADDDLLPISALQHLVFCERQCALIHVERIWTENLLTAQGAVMHRKAHEGKPETLDGERIARGLPLRSRELGLTGVADIVLYRPPDDEASVSLATRLRRATPDELAQWTITPVEYKRGRPKRHDADRVQLVAQAMCLEEMHGVSIDQASLFYGQTRRRQSVPITPELRASVHQSAARLREIVEQQLTPPAVREKKCDSCSLIGECLPSALGRRSARTFLMKQVAASLSAEPLVDDADEPA